MIKQRYDVRVIYLPQSLNCPSFFTTMSVATDQNDLLFLLENAESGSELLEVIDAYQDGEVSFAQ